MFVYAKLALMKGHGTIRFSRHAVEKLDDPTSKKLGVTAERIAAVLRRPECIDGSDSPILMAVGRLTGTLSLCVVYKFVAGDIRVVTFFPAHRGRYESKVLPGR